MNVYFTASLSAKDKYIDQYTNIVTYLTELDHTVDSQHIITMTEDRVNKLSREEILNFHVNLKQQLTNCDFVVADTSFPSVSVGYEISLALWLGKPILIFHDKGGPPSLLRYDKDGRITTAEYNTETYKEKLDTFIASVNKKIDVRYMFLIPPKISLFLEKVALKEKTPKSVYIRRLIENDIDNHDLE